MSSSSSIVLRHVRHLYTTTTLSPMTISKTKAKLRNNQDPDDALSIYKSFTATNNPSISLSSTRHAQSFTVRLLAKSHRFSDIENFLESHKSSPQITQEIFLSSLIRSYGVAGMIDNALKTYIEMTDLGTPRTTLSFNTLLSACVNSKLFDRVPEYFNEFPGKYGFAPDKFSYGILIRAYCEMGKPEIAIEKVEEMEGKGFDVDAIVCTTIVHAFNKKGNGDEAKRFWDEMVLKKGVKADAVTYNVRIRSVQDGEPEGVKELIEEMKNAGIKPDVTSYNYLLTCYCKNGMMDEAKNVFDELLKTKGCNPNAATFRTLVSYMCNNGRFVSAYKVFKKSVKERKIPDFSTLKYLVEGLVEKGHKTEAKEMVRTINKKFSPNMLKAWTQLAEDLGIVPGEEVDSDKVEKTVESLETAV